MITEVLDIAVENPIEYEKIGNEFVALSGLQGEFDVKWFFSYFRQYQALGVARLWKAEDEHGITGVIAALNSPCPFTGVAVVSEAFWFVNTRARGSTVGMRLYKQLEDWAYEIRAARIQMAHLSVATGPATLYERMGFTPFETAYIKWL